VDAIPPAVLLVRDFVNTVEWQEDADGWATPADLAQWFSMRADISVEAMAEQDLRLARRIREGLRSVLLQHAGHEPVATATADLNDALGLVPLIMRVADDGAVSMGGAASPLSFILAAVDTARADGTWSRLKACARDSCRWAYWDSSRNRSGRWCSMAGCGNHVKMRTRRGGSTRPGEVLPVLGQPRPARLVDVAGRAGVSIKTVSNVVTGAVPVAPATRARVEAAIAELDYRPNLAARSLRTGILQGSEG
jgi:predicted RNA-binding Zn ribbon-like protein